MKLWAKILLGLLLGILCGIFFPVFSANIKPLGDVFIRAIKMLIVPLIFSSLVVGVTGMKDPKKLGRIGMKTFSLYLLTTAVAITIGLTIGTVLKPGAGVELGTATISQTKEVTPFSETLINLVPANPIQSMAKGEVLPIIVFAILFGLSLNLVGKKADPLVSVIDAIAEAMYKLTAIVMELAPYGVFALMAFISQKYGLAVLLPLLKVLFGVYLGCIIHAIFTLSGAVSIIARLNPINFFKGIIDALAIAYSTASSSGTLPVTIRCARKNLGVSDNLSSFVLPLGATINMDGTAMYQGVAALFIAQAYGIDLSFGNYVTIILTSTLASIGSAGVPGAGLIMLTLVLNSVGLPVEGIALIAGIDRVLDMARTTVNVVGDCMVTVVVAKSENEIDESIYNAQTQKIELEPA
ncbi:MAG: dicarboxylate/amino acid:cation symporter [Rickettsiales bacterium]|nr:dicarboxylate/amino acid:cation symporter [Rickettsiales bacterium]|tara:strand:+ start:1790 stop:3019 length:1230 start_codon:yes stop_codon:yes gene_type:complete